MAITITPRPPGIAVAMTDPPPARFAQPGPDHAFVVGYFDRGVIAQAANIAALDRAMGPRVNYSSARDEAATFLAEGGRVITATRVLGPGAAAASATLNDGDATPVARVQATSPGEWGNRLTVDVEDAGDGAVRLTIREDDVPVAVSPAVDDPQQLAAWSDQQDIVLVEPLEARLPAPVTGQTLSGGTDDRAGVTPSDWAAAVDRLDRRMGPGILLAPGVSDPEIIAALAQHAADRNRILMVGLPDGVTLQDAVRAAQTLRAELPDTARLVGLFASGARVRPIVGEPDRLVSWAAVQAGIAARVWRDHGPGTPPFGITHGASRSVVRLSSEWSDDDRHALYLEGVNVASDDGQRIACWGYRTLDLADLHHAWVRMLLRWRLEQIAAQFVGPPITPATQASFHAQLESVCQEFVDAAALTSYQVDTESVNTPETAAARERHAVVSIRHTPTSDWVSIVVPILPIA